MLGLKLIKQRIKENKEIKIKKKYQKNLSLVSSVMLRKLRLRKKNGFLIKKTYIIKRLKLFVVPTLVEDKPDRIIKHVRCNDVMKQKMDTADPNKLADDITDIANLCASDGVKDFLLSSVLP